MRRRRVSKHEIDRHDPAHRKTEHPADEVMVDAGGDNQRSCDERCNGSRNAKHPPPPAAGQHVEALLRSPAGSCPGRVEEVADVHPTSSAVSRAGFMRCHSNWLREERTAAGAGHD